MPTPALLKKEACSTKDFLKKAVLVWCCPAPGYIRGAFLFHVACTKKPCVCSCPPATPSLSLQNQTRGPCCSLRCFNLNKDCSECQVLSSTRLYKGDIFPFPGTPACGTGRSHPPFPAHPRRHAPVTFYKRLWAAPAARPPFCKV